jgi:hypothetical protein
MQFNVFELPGKLSRDPYYFIKNFKKFYRKKSMLLKNAKLNNSFIFVFIKKQTKTTLFLIDTT